RSVVRPALRTLVRPALRTLVGTALRSVVRPAVRSLRVFDEYCDGARRNAHGSRRRVVARRADDVVLALLLSSREPILTPLETCNLLYDRVGARVEDDERAVEFLRERV